MKNWYSIQNLAESGASISIRGIVGDWGLSDQDLINELDALGDVDSLEVRINSNGGDLVVALGLFNYLRDHPAKITTYIEGVAASAASVIAMAGDTIIMPSNTAMMIHNPWSVIAGDAKEMTAAAEMLEKLEKALVKTYEARTKQSRDEIKAMLDKETWLTAEEAFELGFCDQVQDIGEGYAIAMAKASGIPESVLNKIADTAEKDVDKNIDSDKSNDQNKENDSDCGSDDTETLNESVRILCEAAGQMELVEPMQALAQSSGIKAVQAVLKKTLNQSLSGIQSQHSQSHQFKSEHDKTTHGKLAAMTLKSLKHK